AGGLPPGGGRDLGRGHRAAELPSSAPGRLHPGRRAGGPVGRATGALRLFDQDPDPLLGGPGRRRCTRYVRSAAGPGPPRHAAGRRGGADRGRPAAGVRRPHLQAQATGAGARQGMSSTRIAGTVVLAIVVAQALVLHAMGRVWICTCGTVRLWVGDIWSPEVSQQLFDWYTPSHVVHGILFYGLLRLLLPRAPVLARLVIAVGIGVSWDIAETCPWA